MWQSDINYFAKRHRWKLFMNSILKFKKVYFLLTIVLFIVEILIAKFAHDRIIRPYIGDLLVVALIYCCIKSFLATPVFPTAIAVLIFSFLVEASQYYHIINKLGLQDSPIARTVMGTSFEWIDVAAYTCGIFIVIYVENIIYKRSANIKTIKTTR